ncbi:MAG: hypothetical protein R3E93_00165 [Thiothrix sp.]
MSKKPSSGSFDIFLGMEYVGGRSSLCLSFGGGLFRKLGWSSGDWLEFDTSEPGKIAFKQIEEPAETVFNARKIKLQSGFYKICFYSALFKCPKSVELSKEKASFNVDTWTLTLEIPEEYRVSQEVLNQPRALSVDDIASAFSKL